MTISTNHIDPITVGIDSDTLALLGLGLVDSKKGVKNVLSPGDTIRSENGESRMTLDDFTSTTQLATHLAEISGAKVRLIEKSSNGHFYLLFSEVKTPTHELSYVIDVGGRELQFDDNLLITNKKEFSDESLSKLSLPFSPVQNICPSNGAFVNADCYTTHLDYLSASFLVADTVEKANAYGATIKANFESNDDISSDLIDEFFEARRFAEEVYNSAVRPNSQRLKKFAAAQ